MPLLSFCPVSAALRVLGCVLGDVCTDCVLVLGFVGPRAPCCHCPLPAQRLRIQISRNHAAHVIQRGWKAYKAKKAAELKKKKKAEGVCLCVRACACVTCLDVCAPLPACLWAVHDDVHVLAMVW